MSPEPPRPAVGGDTALWRVSVRTRGDGAEPLRARFLELAPDGFEELEAGDGEVELAVYLRSERVDEVRSALPDADTRPVAPGCQEAWQAFHRPVDVAGLWLGPLWETAPDPSRSVVIDPGRAFSTGAHPTTRLCVELLARTSHRRSVLDVGCGSGVLAIAAARLGFGLVVAVDNDPVAVETTHANAAANGVAVEARAVDALTESFSQVDVAVANVLLEPVEAILARLDAREAVTSGYHAGELPSHPGWGLAETVELDGWAAHRFRALR